MVAFEEGSDGRKLDDVGCRDVEDEDDEVFVVGVEEFHIADLGEVVYPPVSKRLKCYNWQNPISEWEKRAQHADKGREVKDALHPELCIHFSLVNHQRDLLQRKCENTYQSNQTFLALA